MRLIDADAMRQEWLENGQNEYVYDTNAVLDSIDAQPTIEAAPVRQGRWKWVCGIPQCSVCGKMAPGDPYDGEVYTTAYCPNCGAKMDGE